MERREFMTVATDKVSEESIAAEAVTAEPTPVEPTVAEPTPVEPTAVQAPEPPKSKAGRNLPAAMAVGLTLGISLVLILIFVPKILIGVIAVAIAVATWEVARRLREADVLVPRIPLLLGGQAIVWLSWPYGATGVAGAFAGTALVCMVWRLFDHGLRATPRNFLRDTSITVFVAAWVPLLASFATLLLLEDDGAMKVL